MSITADQWNLYHPVGTKVIAYPGVTPKFAADMGITDYPQIATTTRSAAWNLGHGTPVVLVQDLAGGISLEHIDTDPDPEVWSKLRIDNAQRMVTDLENAVVEASRVLQSKMDRLTVCLGILETRIAERDAAARTSGGTL